MHTSARTEPNKGLCRFLRDSYGLLGNTARSLAHASRGSASFASTSEPHQSSAAPFLETYQQRLATPFCAGSPDAGFSF